MPAPDDAEQVLSAALIQIAGHAERISNLDSREQGRYRDICASLDVTRARLDEIDGALTAIAAQLADLSANDDDDRNGRYQPIPASRWWKLAGAERQAAVDRLRAWVEQIYQPGYGRLAALLPPCWEHHTLCLYTLDWLSELWSVLYLRQQRDDRTIAAQAEWHTRLLPAAADQMAFETAGCRHPPRTASRSPSAGSFSFHNGSHTGIQGMRPPPGTT